MAPNVGGLPPRGGKPPSYQVKPVSQGLITPAQKDAFIERLSKMLLKLRSSGEVCLKVNQEHNSIEIFPSEKRNMANIILRIEHVLDLDKMSITTDAQNKLKAWGLHRVYTFRILEVIAGVAKGLVNEIENIAKEANKDALKRLIVLLKRKGIGEADGTILARVFDEIAPKINTKTKHRTPSYGFQAVVQPEQPSPAPSREMQESFNEDIAKDNMAKLIWPLRDKKVEVIYLDVDPESGAIMKVLETKQGANVVLTVGEDEDHPALRRISKVGIDLTLEENDELIGFIKKSFNNINKKMAINLNIDPQLIRDIEVVPLA